jgi:hypothetical protein
MKPKRKNPYAPPGSPERRHATQGSSGSAPATVATEAAAAPRVDALLAPNAPVALSATPFEVEDRVATSVAVTVETVAVEPMALSADAELHDVIGQLTEVHQETGVSLRCLAALVVPPSDEAAAAQGLRLLMNAGLATTNGLTARGQVLKTKALKKIGLTTAKV